MGTGSKVEHPKGGGGKLQSSLPTRKSEERDIFQDVEWSFILVPAAQKSQQLVPEAVSLLDN